jgi:hypothetical protein
MPARASSGGVTVSSNARAQTEEAVQTSPRASSLPWGPILDSTDYSNTCPGNQTGCTVPSSASTSWSALIFELDFNGTLSVTIGDTDFVGDFYSLWGTSDPTGLTGWTLYGTTQEVLTDSNLIAKHYDSFWTGTGTFYSSTTFNIPISGTVLFAVRDELYDKMVNLLGPSCGGAAVVTDGCSVTGTYPINVSSGWSPAGYEILFDDAGTSGVVNSNGVTSWPPTTFTDGSTASVSVTGAPPGSSASMAVQDLANTQPADTTTPKGISAHYYYDTRIEGLTSGTARICISNAAVAQKSAMIYWDGTQWVYAAGQTVTGTAPSATICGSIPVVALSGTPIGTGDPVTISQPIKFTVAQSGPHTTATLAGCHVSPKSVLADGITHTVHADANCVITATLPHTSSVRYANPAGAFSFSLTKTCLTGTCSTYSRTIYHQFHISVLYSVTGGGTPAPVFHYKALGVSKTVVLAKTAKVIWADGTSYSSTNPIGGTSERWTSTKASGTISSAAAIAVHYQHQFYVRFVASGAGTVPPSAWKNAGSTITITATPNPSKLFGKWQSNTPSITIAHPFQRITTAHIGGAGTITGSFVPGS